MHNVIKEIYCRRPRGPKKHRARNNCYICYYC